MLLELGALSLDQSLRVLLRCVSSLGESVGECLSVGFHVLDLFLLLLHGVDECHLGVERGGHWLD